MKVLITGGAGFIGSHLTDRLISLGNDVSIIDNLSSGRKENLNPQANFHFGDISDRSFMEHYFKKDPPEKIFHTAAQSYVSISTKIPEEDARINVSGSVLLIDLAKKYDVKKIIYSNSGGASYGNPEYLPIDESHPINPVSQYGISKHTVEHYLKMYSQLGDLEYTSLRYANVYGPRQDPYGEGGVVAIFSKKLLERESPIIFGDGNQIRDYCFVNDVIDANIWAMNNGKNECYNVGTGIGTTTQEIFDIIKKETGSQIVPKYAPERMGDAKSCILNPDKLKNQGWHPKYSIIEGIKETIKYFKLK